MRYIASFRMERIGALTIVFDGATVTIASGRYAHVSMTSIESTCVAFAAALQAACIAAGKASATVSYSNTTHAYTLANGGGSFAISFPGTAAGTVAKQVLGFTTGATATSHVSTVRPYYVLITAIDARSGYSGLRHQERSMRKQADDGRGYVLSTSTPVVEGVWSHEHEPLAAVFSDAASAGVPWTWEDLWNHAGRWQEFLAIDPEADDPEADGIWQLTQPDFTGATHERQWRDANVAWRIRIEAVRLGDR